MAPVAKDQCYRQRWRILRRTSRPPETRQRCCDRTRGIAEVSPAQFEFRTQSAPERCSQIAPRDQRASARMLATLRPLRRLALRRELEPAQTARTPYCSPANACEHSSLLSRVQRQVQHGQNQRLLHSTCGKFGPWKESMNDTLVSISFEAPPS